MFGHASQPARIWAYKAKLPTENLAGVMDQLHRAHRYKNNLIGLEIARRKAVDEAVRRLAPAVVAADEELAAAEAAVEAQQDGIRRENQKARRRTATAEQKAALKDARERRRAARADRKAARQAAFADPEFQAESRAIDADAAARHKALRKDCGLHWCSYLLIEQALAAIRSGAPPRFRRWTGDGGLAVQIQGGMPWADAVGGNDRRVRVEILPLAARPRATTRRIRGPETLRALRATGKVAHDAAVGDAYRYALPAADPQSNRSRNKFRAVLHFRIGSDERRKPVWAKIPFHLHRLPPAGAMIKWVYLQRRMVGPAPEWEVQFVLARDAWPRPQAEGGQCGLDVGWRRVAGGLRVAYVVGDDGWKEQLVLPDDLVGRWARVERLQAERDLAFNEARDRLVGFLANAADTAAGVPGWLAERAKNLTQCRSPARLRSLVWHWKDERFDGDTATFEAMEAWRRQDYKDHFRQEHIRRRAIRRRNWLFRRFADSLARRYHTVHVEDTNWRKLKERPLPDQPGEIAAAKANAQIAAVGVLLRFVAEAAAAVVEEKAAYSTLECDACQTVDKFDAATELVHECSGCGKVDDQDERAARVLLQGGAVAADA